MAHLQFTYLQLQCYKNVEALNWKTDKQTNKQTGEQQAISLRLAGKWMIVS